jgi:hypothetical protein
LAHCDSPGRQALPTWLNEGRSRPLDRVDRIWQLVAVGVSDLVAASRGLRIRRRSASWVEVGTKWHDFRGDCLPQGGLPGRHPGLALWHRATTPRRAGVAALPTRLNEDRFRPLKQVGRIWQSVSRFLAHCSLLMSAVMNKKGHTFWPRGRSKCVPDCLGTRPFVSLSGIIPHAMCTRQTQF